MTRIVRAKSLTERAADEIRKRILCGDFELGELLSENALATDLGVSKTPVREALLRLKMQGLVHIHPQRGSFVFDMTRDQIASLGELREVVELRALELALTRNGARLIPALHDIIAAMEVALDADDFAGYRDLDSDFHFKMVETCGNTMLLECYRGFAFRIHALRQRLSLKPNLNGVSLDEHRGIVACLERDDIEQAQQVLSAHLHRTVEKFQSMRQPVASTDEA